MDTEKVPTTTTTILSTDTIISTLLTTSNQDATTEFTEAKGQSLEIFKSHLYFSVLDYFVFSIMLALSGIFSPLALFYAVCARESEKESFNGVYVGISMLCMLRKYSQILVYCHDIISSPEASLEVYDQII